MHLTLEHVTRLVGGLCLHMVMATTTWPYDNGGEAWIGFKEEPIMAIDKGLLPLLLL